MTDPAPPQVPLSPEQLKSIEDYIIAKNAIPVEPPIPDDCVRVPLFGIIHKRFLVGVAGIGIYLLGARGCISKEDAQKGVDMLPLLTSKSPESTESIKITETKSGPNPPKLNVEEITPAVETKAAEPALPSAIEQRLKAIEEKAKVSITPADIKPWIDLFGPLIQGWIDQIKPPAPVPDNIKPKPLPPDPVNPPQPVPDPSGTLKLILTDEQGNPETAMTLDVNTITQVRIAGAQGKVIWNVVAVGNVGRPAFTVPGPDGKPVILGYSIELRNSNSWVQIHAVDIGSGQSVDAKITANQGAQPPPVPNVDPVNPNPVVNPPQPTKSLSLVQLIYDANNQTPQVAILTQNQGWWANTYGSKWQFLTSGTQKQNGLKALAMAQQQGVKPPFLAVWSNDSLVSVKAVPPTATLETISTIVNGVLQ